MPQLKAAIGGQYKFELGHNAGSITPRIDFSWVDRQQAIAINNPNTWIPSYGLMNGRVSWNNEAGDITIAFEGTNLLNHYYAITQNYSYPPVGNYNFSTIDPGPPRMAAISMRKSF